MAGISSRTSSLVTTIDSHPLTITAWRAMTASNQPQRPDPRAAGRRVGGGDIRIRAMVDIQQGSLRPFEQQPLLPGNGLMQEARRVGREGSQGCRELPVLPPQRLELHGAFVVD